MSAKGAVKDDGDYLMLEINCEDLPEDNVGPVASMFYGFSVFYCMTTSLASGGAALGTCGMPEAVVRRLCAEAGFGDVARPPSRAGTAPRWRGGARWAARPRRAAGCRLC
ncbi:hypothetical protein ACIBAG_25515 [Streptomyces sp. NPDC051243]|uniref:hypothetical protein n=1 Tax=Streptomyces sp. NPDC051243 TaxID=3365646 RepID=UPI0037AA68BE